MRKRWNKNTWSVQKCVYVCGRGGGAHKPTCDLCPPSFSYTLIDCRYILLGRIYEKSFKIFKLAKLGKYQWIKVKLSSIQITKYDKKGEIRTLGLSKSVSVCVCVCVCGGGGLTQTNLCLVPPTPPPSPTHLLILPLLFSKVSWYNNVGIKMFLGFCAGLPSTRCQEHTCSHTTIACLDYNNHFLLSVQLLGSFSVQKANKWTVDMFPNSPLFQLRDLHPEVTHNYDFCPANSVSNVNFLDRKWSGGTFLTYHVISVIKGRFITVIRTNSELCFCFNRMSIRCNQNSYF